MSKKMKWIVIALSIALVLELGAAVGFFGYWKPWDDAANTMPDMGSMILTRQPSGELTLTWPEGRSQDRYLVRVMRGEELLQQQWAEEAGCRLEALPEGENLDILVSTAKGYRFLFDKEERVRMGKTDLKATVNLQAPAITNLTVTPDPDTKTVKFQFELEENSVCRMYRVGNDGALTQVQSLEQEEVSLTLGESGDFPIPKVGETLAFAFDAYRFSPGLVYYGTVTEQIGIVREDLLNRDLNLEYTDRGNNVYTFTWDETKGDYYELQQFNTETEQWEKLSRVELDGQRTYTTPHLARHSEFRYRVVAVGGQTLPDSEFAAVSQEFTVTTGNTAVFTTVWPIQELEFYGDVDKTEVIGKAEPVKALCVLDEIDGLFRVRIGDREGYIDSNYCLIDLSEYLGDLCLYDITNSYASVKAAHEYELPGITGKRIVGYERVRVSKGQYLVPLLYPVAQRLEKAAFSAIEQGYKLKIYDAYRPRKATQAMYNQAINLKDQPLPETTYNGKELTDLPELEEGQVLTYGNLMTDFGRYAMNYFLAAGKSRHNRGIAVDLTLTALETGKELKMQTSMHDLSWYSENARDNGNARKLASIMEGVGFEGLRSEWWHFHDIEVQDSLQPEYQMEGVTSEGWKADDQGWRYRRDNGEYYKDCTQIIDGVSCTFDEQGYLVTE